MISINDLKAFGIFKGLDDKELTKIVRICHERNYSEGIVCLTQGNRATNLHLCRSGKVDVIVRLHDPWGKDVKVYSIMAGEAFGYSALLDPPIYTGSGRCSEDVQEIYIDGSEMLDLFEQNPHIGYIVMRNLSSIISHRLEVSREKFSQLMATATPSKLEIPAKREK